MARKLTDDQLNWTLDINGDPLKKELNEVEQSTRKLELSNKSLRTELDKLAAQGKKNSKEYNELKTQISKNNTVIAENKARMAQLRQEIGITSLSMNQLKSRARELQNQLNARSDFGSAAYNKLQSELNETSARMDELRGKSKKTQDEMGGKSNGWSAKVVAGYAAIAVAAQEVYSALDSTISNFLEGQDVSSRVADSFGNYADEVEAAAVANQKLTKVGDEQYKEMAMLASNMGIANNQVNQTVRDSIGLSTMFAKAGLSQETAMKGLANAQAGNYATLSRYIPALRSANTEQEKAAILAELTEKGYLRAQQAANTYTGRIEQIKNAFGDMQEVVGQGIMEGLIDPAQGKEVVDLINDFADALAETGFVRKYVEQLIKPITQIGDIISEVMELFGITNDEMSGTEVILKLLTIAMTAATLPMGLFLDGIQAIVKVMNGDWQGAIQGVLDPLLDLGAELGIVAEDYQVFESSATGSIKDVQNAVNQFSKGSVKAYDDIANSQMIAINAAQTWASEFTDVSEEGQEKLYELRLAYQQEKDAFIQSLIDKATAQGIYNGNMSEMITELKKFYDENTVKFNEEVNKTSDKYRIKPAGSDEDSDSKTGKKANYLTEADDSGEAYQNAFDYAMEQEMGKIEARKQAEAEWQAWLKDESKRAEAEAKAEMDRQLADDETRKQVRQQLQLVTDQQVYDQSLMQLNWFLNQKYISEEEHAKLVAKLNADLITKRMEGWKQYLEMAGALAGSFSNLVQSLQEKDLAAAGDNEEKQKKIRKKYADANFVAMLAEMVAGQAKGVVDIWSKWAEFPPVAIGLTAGLLAATIPQIAAANSERQRVKQLAKGNLWQVIGRDDGRLYNAEYHNSIRTGLYNRPGLAVFNEDPRNPELVVDGRTTRKLRMQYPNIVRTIQYVAQHAAGKYDAVAGAPASPDNQNYQMAIAVMTRAIEIMQTLDAKVDNMYAKITYEQITDAIDKVDFVETEAS